jgi:hypothetical protein
VIWVLNVLWMLAYWRTNPWNGSWKERLKHWGKWAFWWYTMLVIMSGTGVF